MLAATGSTMTHATDSSISGLVVGRDESGTQRLGHAESGNRGGNATPACEEALSAV